MLLISKSETTVGGIGELASAVADDAVASVAERLLTTVARVVDSNPTPGRTKPVSCGSVDRPRSVAVEAGDDVSGGEGPEPVVSPGRVPGAGLKSEVVPEVLAGEPVAPGSPGDRSDTVVPSCPSNEVTGWPISGV